MNIMGEVGGPYEGQVWDGVRWTDPRLPVVSTPGRAHRKWLHTILAFLPALVVVALIWAFLAWGRATFGLDCSQRAIDDFGRLENELPWKIVGEQPTTDDVLVFRTVEGSGDTDECGPFVVIVAADEATALFGLSEVLRDAGFPSDIATGGSDSGTRRTFIEGRDEDGRTMNITLYEQPDGRGTLLDAYVTNP